MSTTPQPNLQPPVQKQNTGLIIAIVLSVVAIPVLLICMGIMVGLLLPAMQASREAARRVQCSNNLKQIALAVHNYADAHQGAFPPAYTVDENGKPLHSWRTLILPYLGQEGLYSSIDLTKPWDDPANQAASSTQVSFYVCPSAPQNTTPPSTVYQVVVDPSSAFPGSRSVKIAEIADGTSNTLMIYETPYSNAVPWMSPQDTDIQKVLSGGKTNHSRGCMCATCDGAVQFLSSTMNEADTRAIITRDGGEEVSF